jgi:PTH1 family peptidyl-tRNA hydrolase
VVDRLAQANHILIRTKRLNSHYGTGQIESQAVVLAKPMTFMNRSGEAARKVLNFFRIGLEDLIVIHDDLDIPLGRIRFKQRGGDGGHQGIRSIIEFMRGNNFLRLKVGIGRPPQGTDPAEYVLREFEPSEESRLDEMLTLAAEALKVMLLEGLQTAMNRYQKKIKT